MPHAVVDVGDAGGGGRSAGRPTRRQHSARCPRFGERPLHELSAHPALLADLRTFSLLVVSPCDVMFGPQHPIWPTVHWLSSCSFNFDFPSQLDVCGLICTANLQAAMNDGDFAAAAADLAALPGGEQLVPRVLHQQAAKEEEWRQQRHREGPGKAVRYLVGQVMRHKRCGHLIV